MNKKSNRQTLITSFLNPSFYIRVLSNFLPRQWHTVWLEENAIKEKQPKEGGRVGGGG